jgi:DNA-binding transcriptional LysR family regulator
VDLGCIILPEQELDHIYLTTDKLAVVVSMEHPLAAKSKIDLQDLCEFPFILTEGTTGKMVLALFKRSRFFPNIQYSNIQIMSMLSLVSSGVGVSVTAELSIPIGGHGRLGSYVVKPLLPIVKREICLAVQNIQHLSPAADAFVKVASKLQRAGKLRHLET